ncbi:Low-affinity Fe [Lipomyces doorenjongii]
MICSSNTWIRSPGRRMPMEDRMDIPDIENAVKTTSVYFTNGKTTGFEKALDYATSSAGSTVTLYLMGIILIAWVVIGIVYQAPIKWQIVMEDGQSIQCFLQQLNHYQSLLRVITRMRSCNMTVQRLFCKIYRENIRRKAGSPIGLPARTRIDRLSNGVAKILGSLVVVILYWIGVVVWLACGTLWTNAGNAPPYTGATTGSNPEYAQWGNDWQMYINTAVAVELLVTSVFLQNIRHRHSDLAEKYLTEIAVLDFQLEHKLRDMTKDIAENEMVKTEYPPRNKIAGIVVWLAIGTLMHWNSNWWLIIGTYTGLAGFFDGFVLRNVYSRIDRHIFAIIGVEVPEERPPNIASRGNRISNWIAGVCSHANAVIVALFTLIGLVSVSSALKWTVTGQLISNTPTMVIEGFFLLILIQAANWKDMDMRVELYNIYIRRRTLLDFLETSDVYAY